MSSTSSKPNNLTIIIEKTIDLKKLQAQGFDLLKSITVQGWQKYFALLNGPVYPQLVKELWDNAHIEQNKSNTGVIKTTVIGCQITITPLLIAQVIGCDEEGIDIEKYKYNSPLTSSVNKQLYDFSDNKAETSSLKPIINLWYKILASNLMPKPEHTRLALNIDKHFLYFLKLRVKINLPITIFNYMKSCIEMSQIGKSGFIPYGRVISELLIHQGIVKKAKCGRLTNCLATSWGSPLDED
jgi:hypothetical protein